MCVAIPGRIESITEEGASRKGKVRYTTGELYSVELAMVEVAEVGDYVIVHSGFAIRKLTPQAAEEAISQLEGSG
ncbi:MAG: HypC/HybG/HupF family hydrogenase formation chaperone [Actinomycetota bacterium]|nr:HypC/HybG/HupF family hydrogenase formation chaperone [Actinomycetota bacterium]